MRKSSVSTEDKLDEEAPLSPEEEDEDVEENIDRVSSKNYAKEPVHVSSTNFANPDAVSNHTITQPVKKRKCAWTTQLTSEDDKEALIRITIIELFIYLIYLVFCCIIVYGMISPTAYYYTKVLSDLFLDTPFSDNPNQIKTFRTSADVKDFWKFAESSMLNALYWEEWYDDPELEKPVETKDQGILYENRIISRPRLRQIRVTNTSCPVIQSLSFEKSCYPSYSTSNEELSTYSSSQRGTAWNHGVGNATQTQNYWGQLELYKGSGAFVFLGLRRAETEKIMADLKSHLWITRATRVVFLEFTVYNANLNLFCSVRLAWEFPITGGLVTSWIFRTFRLFTYITPFDYFLLVCQIIFILFTIYFTVQEIVEMCGLGCRKYFTDIWSYLDLLILALSYTCIGFTIYKTVVAIEYLEPLLSEPDISNKFLDFTSFAFWESQFVNTMAVLFFFCWIKIFKYISFNRTMSQLSTTLSRCSKDILGFGIMFFIVFLAFAQLGYLLFGSQVRSFSSFYASCFTLLRLLLGDFEFREIEAANRILGPAFYLMYIFLVFFVLLNMFLAIINDTYSEVKAEIQAHKEEYRISDFIIQHFAFWRRKADASTKGLESAADGKITHHEIESHLIRAAYTHDEIQLFLARYALDNDEVPLDEEETEKLIEELKNNRKSADLSHGDFMRSHVLSESDRVDRRITAMEVSLTTLIGQLDQILTRLPEVENETEAEQSMNAEQTRSKFSV